MVPLAIGLPFRARNPLTTTSAPIWKSVLRSPCLSNWVVEPASIAHAVTLPSGFLTSMCTQP